MSPKPHVPCPAGITIERHEDYIHIVEGLVGWSGRAVRGFMVGFSCFVWYGCIEKVWALLHAPEFWLKSAAVLPLAIGLVVTYITLGYWKNKTHIWLSQTTLEVYQAPLWMPGHKRLEAQKIEQAYVKHTDTAQGGARTEVRVKLKSGADLKITRVCYPIENAQFIAQEIEAFLGLTDRPVLGEYGSEA